MSWRPSTTWPTGRPPERKKWQKVEMDREYHKLKLKKGNVCSLDKCTALSRL